jgi:WD40 repeat protein
VYSPDGSQIASASYDHTAIIWDAETGDLLFVLEGHGENLSGLSRTGINGVDFSPDGAWLATAGRDGTARIWDTRTGEELLVLNHTSGLLDVRFSPDGSLLTTASDELDATAVLWNVSSGEQLVTLPQVHGDRIWAVDFSPDGRRLATSGGDGSIKLWQVEDSGKRVDLIATLLGHTGSAFDVSFSPDGQVLASISVEMKLWDLSVLPTENQDTPTATTLTTPRLSLPNLGSNDHIFFTADSSTFVFTYPTWSGEEVTARFISLSIDGLVNLARARLTRPFSEAECLLFRIERCS